MTDKHVTQSNIDNVEPFRGIRRIKRSLAKKHEYIMARTIQYEGELYKRDQTVILNKKTRAVFIRNGYIK